MSTPFSSSPSSSFDPALHLHSDLDQDPLLLPSVSNSDDLEALHTQQQELDEARNKAGIVIQHRSWGAQDVLRSEDIFNPETPSHARPRVKLVPESSNMILPSSPVLYPPSSSPPIITKKRKLFQTFESADAKKPKTFGAFPNDVLQPEKQPLVENEVFTTGATKHMGAENDAMLVVEDIDDLSPPQSKLARPGSGHEVHERSPSLPPVPRLFARKISAHTIEMQTCSGQQINVPLRKIADTVSFEKTIAQRSVTAEGRAMTSYYGIDIHTLVDEASQQRQLEALQKEAEQQQPLHSIEEPQPCDLKGGKNPKLHQMWTEKYRAKKFTDLIGDERTHRLVLRWLKAWDPIVFPGSVKSKPKRAFEERYETAEQQQRKILLLTGPAGLGKTTLAHVCARQAGYEVLEINASDDRSRDVVTGRIKTALATETVRGIKESGKARKAGRPVCVVVDEVDGVVTGSSGSGGEGGFMKALIDLVQLDQRNSSYASESTPQRKNKKGDNFRLLRPLILICNDVYAPSLRPLRNSPFAEIVHVRKPALDKVISRLKNVFEREDILCDNDAVRRLCESAWGLGTRKQNSLGSRGAGEGDIRSVLVQGEWIAHKLRATREESKSTRLTRKWMESHLGDTQAASGQKGLGRGGVREVVERVFLEGAGLSNLPTALSADDARLVAESKETAVGVTNLRKRSAINALREMIDTCGDHDRLMADCFATYPTLVYQDDVNLTKPNAGYDWLHFHDCLSSRVFSGQEWELNPYLSTSACGFHHLFAVADKGEKIWSDEKGKEAEELADAHPFSGLRADFAAHEATKENKAILTAFQSSFSGPLLRLFSSTDTIATELIPSFNLMVAPDVKPVIIGGNGGLASVASVRKETERACIRNAVRIMSGLNVSFEKVRVEIERGGAHATAGFAYRMQPSLDNLTNFQMGKTTTVTAPVRYSIRQVLDQELLKEKILQNSATRHARSILLESSTVMDDDKENENAAKDSQAKVKLALAGAKRDFFGRIINEARATSAQRSVAAQKAAFTKMDKERVWVSFNEGYSNAVRKPITLKELMESFE